MYEYKQVETEAEVGSTNFLNLLNQLEDGWELAWVEKATRFIFHEKNPIEYKTVIILILKRKRQEEEA